MSKKIVFCFSYNLCIFCNMSFRSSLNVTDHKLKNGKLQTMHARLPASSCNFLQPYHKHDCFSYFLPSNCDTPSGVQFPMHHDVWASISKVRIDRASINNIQTKFH